jgi:uncharacterized integral membrane protein
MSVIFLLLLGFVLKNMDDVVLRYFLGFEWQTPLACALLIFFGLGIASGVLASLGIIVRQRRAILGLKRELRERGHVVAAPATAESI